MSIYEQRVQTIRPLTIDKMVELSYDLLPREKRNAPWHYVNHGVDLAYDEEWLLAYMAAYGEMHQIKCRAALQNLPFESILTNLEIIDWGCGQGLATVCLLEMLAERGMSHLVRKITLIEPSHSAIERAKLNVSCCVDGSVTVVPIEKYLPSDKRDDNTEVTSIRTQMPFVIHLFSNILDIPSIDIKYLSQIVSDCPRTNCVVCMGPRNQNSYRIKEFSGFFHDKEVFSEIDSRQFAYTQRTHHNVTCRTACFKIEGNNTGWDGSNEYTQYANRKASWDYQDDYSPVEKLFAGLFPAELLMAYEQIDNQLSEGDHLFLRPNISGDTPDMVLFRPNVGVAIIQLFNDTVDYNEDAESDKSVLAPVIETVNGYCQRFIDLHIESLKEKVEYVGGYRTLMKQVIICLNNTKAELDTVKHSKYVRLIGKDRISNFFKDDADIEYRNRFYTSDFQESFLKLVSTPWHSYREGVRMKLTKTQERLIESRAKTRQKVKGHAGSGKTQVMAWRAVKAMVRTGKPILVLTFNITLRNYIRYRIQQIPADFNWANVTILNYHEFYNSQALNVNRKVKKLAAYNNRSYFEGCAKKSGKEAKGLTQYAAIFIDEVQDYESVWLEILQKYFLEEDGEFVVFGDKIQNVYGRSLDNTNEISVPNVPGRWNELKGKIPRFQSMKISKLTQKFSEQFLYAEYDAEQKMDFDDDSICIKYNRVNSSEATDKCGSWSLGIMQKYNLEYKDTAIIAPTSDMLREIEEHLKENGIKAKTTFMQKGLHDKVKANSPARFRITDRDISRSKKLHFTADSPLVKLSTIHSFKGWESDNVILFIQKPEQGRPAGEAKPITEAPSQTLLPAVIYTAITRARKKLFIINVENDYYHQFFSQNIQCK